MSVPADIRYFLDCSFQSGHIAGDVHHYFMYDAPGTAEFIDAYEDRGPFDRHWSRLIDMGLYVEDRFLSWRFKAAREDKLTASFFNLTEVHYQLEEMVGTYSNHLVDRGYTSLTPDAVAEADKQYGFLTNMQVIARSMHRAAADFSGLKQEELFYFRQDMHRRSLERREAERANLLRAIANSKGDTEYQDAPEVEKTRAMIKASRTEDKLRRRVIKRSIKLAQKLMGTDTTRMFVGGDRVRFEGEHAVYELRRTGNMVQHYGGSKLSVFDKENDIHLCDVCIYTPNVPILDHVASIALHIRAGHEEDILRIGNPYNVSEAGKSTEWLQPHLPAKAPVGPRLIRIYDHDETPVVDRFAKIDRMRKIMNRHIFRLIEPAVPALHMVRSVERDFQGSMIADHG